MTPLMKKLKALWLAVAGHEAGDVQFSRGLTVRSTTRVRGCAVSAKVVKFPRR